jgi:hypothetical protein
MSIEYGFYERKRELFFVESNAQRDEAFGALLNRLYVENEKNSNRVLAQLEKIKNLYCCLGPKSDYILVAFFKDTLALLGTGLNCYLQITDSTSTYKRLVNFFVKETHNGLHGYGQYTIFFNSDIEESKKKSAYNRTMGYMLADLVNFAQKYNFECV